MNGFEPTTLGPGESLMLEVSMTAPSRVGAENFNEHVVPARGQDHVHRKVAGADLSAEGLDVAVDREADHGLDREADAEWVGDRDDLEDVGLEEALHSKADRRLTEVDPFGQICEVGTSIQLECRDDLEVLFIEVRRVGSALSDGIPL